MVVRLRKWAQEVLSVDTSAQASLGRPSVSFWGVGLEILVVFSLAIALWIDGLLRVGNFQVDDAFITFSYSKNLALGKGPIYGFDLQDEGYSNFLWMVFGAVGELLSVGALAFSRFLSHVLFAGLLLGIWLTSRKLGGRFAAALCTLFLASASDFQRAAQSGMETVGYASFLGLGICHYLLEDARARRWSMVWFCAAALTRIDGFVPLSLLIALESVRWFFAEWRLLTKSGGGFFSAFKAPSFRHLFRWVLIGLLPVAFYWIWRAWYYGLPFPLPYYAKATLGILAEGRGADYVWSALRETGLWIVLLGGALGVGARGFGERKSNSRAGSVLVVAGLVGAMLAYVAHVGGDWMPFNRMLLPVFCPALLLCAAGIGSAFRAALCGSGESERPTAPLTGAHVQAACVGLLALLCIGFAAQHASDRSVETPIEGGKLGLAKHVKTHTRDLWRAQPFVKAMVRKPGDKLVTDYGGVFAYGTDASVIEMWGLANREIALRGNTDGIAAIYGKTCIACYPEFQPDYFHPVTPLLRDERAFRRKRQVIQQIFQGAALDRVLNLQKNYRVGRVSRPADGKVFWFLERERPGVAFERREVGAYVVDFPPIR